MKQLEERILRDGKVLPGGILKVDGFLNHQIDPQLLYDMALELKHLFEGEEITKILTIEASGIAIASMVGYVFGCPLVFAKRAGPATSPIRSGASRSKALPTATPTPSSCRRSISARVTAC